MSRPRFILPCVAAATLLAMNAHARGNDVFPFPVHERTLANGLKVIVVPTGFPNLVSVQIPVMAGSRNEVEPGKSGFAHFFEHMMFRGTPENPPERYQAVMTQAGARDNAYTTDDYTNYHTTFAREDLEKILALDADRFQHLAYGEAAFKTESRAVLGEYNKNSANPIRKLLEVQRDHAFTTHTYKHTTMGFLEDIEDMPNQYEYSKTFFDRWYRPEYATLLVAGDVQPEEVFALAEKYWGSWRHGTYEVKIPAEPAPKGPVYAHVPWSAPGLPLVTVAFHGPAFSETEKDYAALDMLMNLSFGHTSGLYQRLVVQEQTVDDLFPYFPDRADPALATVFARLKRPEDAVAVRDAMLRTFAAARQSPPDARRLADAVANARYGLLRSFDTTENVAATLAAIVRYRRSVDTLNQLWRVYDSLTPADLQAAGRKYFTDAGLVVTTLSKDALPEAVATPPSLASFAPAAAPDVETVELPSSLPRLDVKLLFAAGSAHDPEGEEGLAALSAAMIAEAGSRALRIDEIEKAFFPMAASFEEQVDREMTTFTGVVHEDNWRAFLDVALPMLTDPGFREEDFRRLKDRQLNALKDDLRSNNEEELGKERLQANVFAGTPYGHPTLGTVAGIEAITLDDVKAFVRSAYTRASLTLGLSGDVPDEMKAQLRRELGRLPEGPALAAPTGVVGRMPAGREVEIVQKDTRAVAVSFGYPIPVTRSHPDFVPLYLVRTWLGEHRSSVSHLYRRIREVRGMNYGDYAYIEAFPRGMFQFFPDPNLARRAQLFEVWLRPLRSPEEAHMALRIAIHELDALGRHGLSRADFEATRDYLMKNVFVMTATQDQQIGYALDSRWYGIPEFTEFMRDRLSQLTLAEVNRVARKYVQTRDLSIVMVTGDAPGLRERLLADTPSAVEYDGEKPQALLGEDRKIGAMKLSLKPGSVRVTPVEEVFAGALAGVPEGFTPLFNGKDLTGWHISQVNHHGNSRGWSVKDGVLLATQDRPGNGGILLTDRRYGDFEVSLEIKPDWGCDGGLFLRSNEEGQAYQVMIDYLEGGSVGGIYGEGLKGLDPEHPDGRENPEWRKAWREGDWNTLRARIEGAVPHIQVWLNGRKLVDWTDTANHAAGGATEGMIALQMHFSNATTPRWKPGGYHRFRNIAIREIAKP
jgi:zinc protease